MKRRAMRVFFSSRMILGDDAAKVKWVRLDRPRNFYASHESIIRQVIEKHGAFKYWEGA